MKRIGRAHVVQTRLVSCFGVYEIDSPTHTHMTQWVPGGQLAALLMVVFSHIDVCNKYKLCQRSLPRCLLITANSLTIVTTVKQARIRFT